MTSKAISASALGDVRMSSYDPFTANPDGYVGTIEDALTQIRFEDEAPRSYFPLNMSRERYALLGYLGLLRSKHSMSGFAIPAGPSRVGAAALKDANALPEDWSVEYGAPAAPVRAGKFSLAYAQQRFPQNFAA